MSGSQIAAEVAQALADVARDVGTGEFLVTLIEPAPAATPWGQAGTPTEYDRPAMKMKTSLGLIDGTLIQAKDKFFMVAYQDGVEPETGWGLTYLGKSHRVIEVHPADPAGYPHYFMVQARA